MQEQRDGGGIRQRAHQHSPPEQDALPFVSGADGYILGFMYVPGETVNMALPQCCIDRVAGILEGKGIKFEFIEGVQEFDPESATFAME